MGTLARGAALAPFLLVLAAGCGGGGGSSAPGPTSTASSSPTPAPSGSALAIYVANFGNNTVTVYNSAVGGNAAPVRTVGGAATGLTATRAVAVDATGQLYVANLVGPASISAFPSGASGNLAPTRTIAGLNTQLYAIYAIAVNADGSIAASNHPPNSALDSILVFGPGANGNATPVHNLTGTSGLATEMGVAYDAIGQLHTIVVQPGNYATNALLTFAPGADATAAPVGNLSGSATLLDTSSYLAPGFPAVAVPQATPQMYVAMPPTNTISTARVMAFPTTASGNIAPQFTISGSATTLSQPVGVAVDAAGNTYVLDATGSIAIFGPGASGNVAPIRVISGSNTGMSNPVGIAVGL